MKFLCALLLLATVLFTAGLVSAQNSDNSSLRSVNWGNLVQGFEPASSSSNGQAFGFESVKRVLYDQNNNVIVVGLMQSNVTATTAGFSTAQVGVPTTAASSANANNPAVFNMFLAKYNSDGRLVGISNIATGVNFVGDAALQRTDNDNRSGSGSSNFNGIPDVFIIGTMQGNVTVFGGQTVPFNNGPTLFVARISTSTSTFGAIRWVRFSRSAVSGNTNAGMVGTGVDVGCNNTNIYISGNIVGLNTTLGGNTGSFSCQSSATGCAPFGFIAQLSANNGNPTNMIVTSNSGSSARDVRVGDCGSDKFSVWALGTSPAGRVFPGAAFSAMEPSTWLIRFDQQLFFQESFTTSFDLNPVQLDVWNNDAWFVSDRPGTQGGVLTAVSSNGNFRYRRTAPSGLIYTNLRVFKSQIWIASQAAAAGTFNFANNVGLTTSSPSVLVVEYDDLSDGNVNGLSIAASSNTGPISVNGIDIQTNNHRLVAVGGGFNNVITLLPAVTNRSGNSTATSRGFTDAWVAQYESQHG